MNAPWYYLPAAVVVVWLWWDKAGWDRKKIVVLGRPLLAVGGPSVEEEVDAEVVFHQVVCCIGFLRGTVAVRDSAVVVVVHLLGNFLHRSMSAALLLCLHLEFCFCVSFSFCDDEIVHPLLPLFLPLFSFFFCVSFCVLSFQRRCREHRLCYHHSSLPSLYLVQVFLGESLHDFLLHLLQPLELRDVE